MEELSKMELLSRLPLEQKEAFLNSLTPDQKADLIFNWSFNARPKQLPPPGNYSKWLLLAGRGFGKTITGANYVISEVEKAKQQGKTLTIGLIGANNKEIERVMVNGKKAGILSQCDPRKEVPVWVSGQVMQLRWKNGTVAYGCTGEKPDSLKGLEFDLVWIDELAKFQYLDEIWNELLITAGRASEPKIIITTTPRPLQILRDLVKDPTVYVTRGSTFENNKLTEKYLKDNLEQFKGSRLERQEFYGEILDDVQGALWSRNLIKHIDYVDYFNLFVDKDKRKTKISKEFGLPELIKQCTSIIIAVDPATTANIKSDETGIIVAGKDKNGRGLVLEDKSGKYSVQEWTTIVNDLYIKYSAKYIVAETNQGGDMVEFSMKNSTDSKGNKHPNIKVKKIHAREGKVARAQPVSLLYDQGKIFHMQNFLILEDQMCCFTGKPTKRPKEGFEDEEVLEKNKSKIKSPDRLDALVYALSELFLIETFVPRGSINIEGMW